MNASDFDPSSRTKLTRRDVGRFPGETLFAKLARVLCEAECLPRRELYEAWEVARRARRHFRGGRVVDLACGHGLVAWTMLLLDDSSPEAIAADARLPPSAAKVGEAITAAWPRVAGRVRIEERAIADVELGRGDLVVATHACGTLTDRVIDRVLATRCRVVLLPCCHDEELCDDGGLRGWLDLETAIDTTRAARLRANGYEVRTQTIPRTITAKNRLLLAAPSPTGESE
ncbi:MAG TPA: methyltransferase [Polyangiaceae bacterium]